MKKVNSRVPMILFWSLMVASILMGIITPVVEAAQGSENTEESSAVKEPMEDLTIVAGSGLVGAILGLSTLAFADQPSQNLRHILVGGSLGVILGVGIIAWTKATKSQELYNENASHFSPSSSPKFSPSSFVSQTPHPSSSSPGSMPSPSFIFSAPLLSFSF